MCSIFMSVLFFGREKQTFLSHQKKQRMLRKNITITKWWGRFQIYKKDMKTEIGHIYTVR